MKSGREAGGAASWAAGNRKAEEGKEGELSKVEGVRCWSERNEGEGVFGLVFIGWVIDNLQPKLAIVYSFNLKPLKPASNLLNLQNILGFTIPSYFKLFNFLINYKHIYYSKFPNFSIYYFPKHSLIMY